MYIPFLDLAKVNTLYEPQLSAAIEKVIEKGKFVLDGKVKEFEANFAKYIGVNHCVGVGSGLDALIFIFEAYKILGKLKDGDEVIVPANTYFATILSIVKSGLIPVFVEPDEKTFNIDVKKLEKAIRKKTKAILAVHLYGLLADVIELRELAKKYNLLLIEDAAQAHGAMINGKKAGSFGDAAAFSFYPTKNLGAIGEAGLIASNDTDFTTIIKSLRNYGKDENGNVVLNGKNSRLDEIQAAVLDVKLKYLDLNNDKRRRLAKLYFENIVNEKIILPTNPNDKETNWHLFVIRSKKRNNLINFLEERGIGTQVHYRQNPVKMKIFKKFINTNFPITNRLYSEVLSLPLNIAMTENQILYVVEQINKF